MQRRGRSPGGGGSRLKIRAARGGTFWELFGAHAEHDTAICGGGVSTVPLEAGPSGQLDGPQRFATQPRDKLQSVTDCVVSLLRHIKLTDRRI